MLACICSDGTWIPTMIIFKGVRWNESLKNDALFNAVVKLSPKGWYGWLMDSHSAHIGPEILKTVKDKKLSC
ncbi:jg13504 [Pararge aegeria aegeria]|uniref:Jg13504 protein n=1 Tax=Pararge aegeria aegeria TaxID=348720 RepID=A0A8S4QVF6_9NEOP|nr:jg13504 [Pararge aegeria aegeria]